MFCETGLRKLISWVKKYSLPLVGELKSNNYIPFRNIASFIVFWITQDHNQVYLCGSH